MLKKSFLILLFAALAFTKGAFAEDVPQPVGWVNDFANVISPEYRGKFNSLIGELEEKTSAEIAVVTAASIAPYDERAYARMLFDSWKPGKKGKDNGVLILLAVKERRWRIETGYGVEGILPDGLCGEIGRNYMVPYFKQGDYGKGLYSGVTRICKIIAKNANVDIGTAGGGESVPSAYNGLLPDILIVIFILLFIFFSIANVFFGWGLFGTPYGGGGDFGGGGGFGGGGFGGGGGGGGGAGGGF